MDLSIIIVNWNSADYLRKCLATIVAETQGIEYEIVVIDSASFDGSELIVRQEFPQVKFIQSSENLGFSGCNNAAFAISRGEVVLFLNPDTEVVGNALSLLYATLRSIPNGGALGCKLLNSDGSTQTSCIQSFPTILNQVLNAEVLRRLTPRSHLWGMRAIYDFVEQPLMVEMISGACLMMYRSVFEKIGGFSTEYFMYAEDADICYKIQRAGFANYYFGGAEIVHYGGGSSQQARSNFASIMTIHSISQFMRKFRGPIYSICYRAILSASALLRVMVLAVISPVFLLKNGFSRFRATLSKWLAVINWGLGRSHWVREFRRNDPLENSSS